MIGAEFDADDAAGRGRAAEPAGTTAEQRRQDVGQTSTEVGADVVVDERVDARVAVGKHVAHDAKHGVPASERQQADRTSSGEERQEGRRNRCEEKQEGYDDDDDDDDDDVKTLTEKKAYQRA